LETGISGQAGILKSKKDNFDLVELQRHLKGKYLSGGDLIIEIGSLFLGAPYKADALEKPGRETLVITFAEFDCTTFVETILALARCATAGKMSWSEFRQALQLIRYRGGIIDGYSSRLHYFTDWLRDNEKKKILKDISRQFDAEEQRKAIDYMTAHQTSYPALRNEGEFQKILALEKNISRKAFHIIDEDTLSSQIEKIQNGDIIAFTTNQEGLDVAHVGLAKWQGKNLHLLHASSKEGSVVISKKTLVAYLKSTKMFTGIIAARPSISAPLSNQR
jgi:hypothetical protein